MNNQKILITVVFLLLIGATTGLILHAQANQRLGDPGVRTQPQPATGNLQVILPTNLPGYTAEVTTQAEIVVLALPRDTSFGRCIYRAPDGFQTTANVVLMGTDRTSIHKPEVCLTGQGWVIDDAASKVENIHMRQPFPYDLPVMRLTATLNTDSGGQHRVYRGTYVYWFVDATKMTPKQWQIMSWMARDILFTGVLDRFSYISYFSACVPGQEDETFARMKKVIVESVPQFQLVPKNGAAGGR
jgi:hypothetical protein